MNNSPPKGALPEWAPRVKKHMVRRLYENDAKGIYDEYLINQVGYTLRARCQSFIAANEAYRGRVPCPHCERIVLRRDFSDKEELLRCECGWELTWRLYFRTIQHKQLSGAEPVIDQFQEFVDRFPNAQNEREKVFLIDRLLHGFHWFLKKIKATRPVAVNLIEGRLWDVIDFLDGLSYGEKSTPGVRGNKAEWEINIQNARGWRNKGKT